MSEAFKRIKKGVPDFALDSHLAIQTVDMHTGGEPLRVVISGFPELREGTVLEQRKQVQQKYDHVRKLLMLEPRGHADMYGCLLVPPNDNEADFGVIFMHNEGYSTMCGHAIIALATLAVQADWVSTVTPETKVIIDAPCGRIVSYVLIQQGKVAEVRFEGVPSFVLHRDHEVSVEGLGRIQYDIAYGGAFYAYVNADDYGISLSSDNIKQLISDGMAVKNSIIQSGIAIEHPYESDLSFLYGTIFIGHSDTPTIHSRNVCVFADGEVDRSPTGSGVSGRLAVHYAKQEVELCEELRIESITGSVFSCQVLASKTYSCYPAVLPEVTGTAWVTGIHTFLLDDCDPFPQGLFIR